MLNPIQCQCAVLNVCHLLIFQNTKVEDDPFVPTPGDLAGFWDMVHIQVVHIHTLFAELRKFQKNDWKRIPGEVSFMFPEPKKEPEKPKKVKRVKKANTGNGKTGNESKSGSEPKSEAAKARDEARKKMLEDRKKQMKLKQQQKENSSQENEVIFVEF